MTYEESRRDIIKNEVIQDKVSDFCGGQDEHEKARLRWYQPVKRRCTSALIRRVRGWL